MELIKSLFQLAVSLFPIFFMFIAANAVIYALRYIPFSKSGYRRASGNGFFRTMFSKGDYGEYLTFRALERLDIEKELFTNVYIPKSDGTTSESDLIMVCNKGIFVFESKNYSGWIFGDEKSKYWTQSLKSRQKNKFLNPIWQNAGHIKALLEHLKDVNDQNVHSYIVFSERCTLKKVTYNSNHVVVLKRGDLYRAIQRHIEKLEVCFTSEGVNALSARLNKIILVDQATKEAHIESIKSKLEKPVRVAKKMNIPDSIEPIQENTMIVESKEIESIEGTSKAEKQTYDEPQLHTPDQETTNTMEKVESAEAIVSNSPSIIPIEDTTIYKELRAFRLERSRKENIKPYLIFNDNQMKEIISKMPENHEDLKQIKGFAEVKVN